MNRRRVVEGAQTRIPVIVTAPDLAPEGYVAAGRDRPPTVAPLSFRRQIERVLRREWQIVSGKTGGVRSKILVVGIGVGDPQAQPRRRHGMNFQIQPL